MKRIFLLLAAVFFTAVSLTGCSPYTSHYRTIGHVRSERFDSAWISFVKFEGVEVFKLKCKSGEPTAIRYSGELETGSLTVYYDGKGAKAELFSLQTGDEVDAYSEQLAAGTVYVIVETDGKCQNGACSFEISYD